MENYAHAILEVAAEKSYCFEKEINGVKALVICGKVHLFNISMQEFQHRINNDYERYGERARMAMTNESVPVSEFLAVVKTHTLAAWDFLGGEG